MADRCVSCDKAVYFAEKLKFKNEVWHKHCFRCTACGKGMKTAAEALDNNSDPYCSSCYGKKFGPKGYGYGTGAGVMRAHNDVVEKSGKNTSSSNNATAMNIEGAKVHQEQEEKKREEARKKKAERQTVSETEKKSGRSGGSRMTFGGSPKCPICGKSVYFAEKLKALGDTYHKTCFKCNDCGKVLGSIGEACDAEGLIWCKNCYGKHFGPKGYGFGSALRDTGISRSDVKSSSFQ
mmetsp:Transcript_13160/g.15066  ORF Transcript_13160/g.15066 Transcript_13160/m.15066 type:complete len:236 (-) Transcript_13160:356-1063(-)